MKSSLLKIALTLVAVFSVAVVLPVAGEDYLVIKKKGGPTQKVPLNFSPEQIESFQVESGQAPAGEKPKGQTAPAVTEPAQEEGAEAEEESGKPMELQPGAPSASPMILKDGKGAAPSGTPMRPPARPAVREEPKVAPVEPAKREITGPTAATPAPRGQGLLTVNVYKLPENIQALPEYSAFKPKQTLTTDRINLDPAKGDNEPAGLTETDGMGLRFIGTFSVSGEGIFRFRLLSKDGSRMHIDDKTVIENDGVHEPTSKNAFLHLSEGIHTIIVDSFNAKGPPVLRLFVEPPLGKEEIFSASTGIAGWKEPAKPYDVLWGQVYFVPKGNFPEGPDFSKLSPIGRIIAPQLNITGGEGIEGLPGRKDMVGIRYQGYFKVDGAGIFAFRLVSDYFARLSIGQSEVAEVVGGTKNDPQGKLGWAFLQKGSYPISVDYFHPSGEPRLELHVTQPDKQEELFSPINPLVGYSSETGQLSLVPAFVYFLKPGTKKLPNYNKMTPSGMFFAKAVDFPLDRGTQEFPGVPKRTEWFGLRFYVKFTLSTQESGVYKFRVIAKDAARLIIGKKMVVNAEGPGKIQDQSGSVELKEGSHELFLDYLQTTGPNALQLYITPPGGQEKIFAFQ